MYPVATRVLLCLVLGCSLMAVGYAGVCCGTYASAPSLSYNLERSSTVPRFTGNAGVAYTTSLCNDCITVGYNLAPTNSCTFKGKLPGITSYTCQYYLSDVREFVAEKQRRTKLPCSYNTYIDKNVNSTHYQSCSTSYMGIATAEFDISGPAGTAKIECKSLFALPQSCNIYSI